MSDKRLAIVTGGGRGIGRAIVMKLAAQGRRVVAIDLNPDNLSETQKLAQEAGFQDVLTEELNITDSDAMTALFEKLGDQYGGISILVNNAGITKDGLIVGMSDEAFDKVIEINLKASFVATRAASKQMMRNRWGRLVHISSVAGVMGNPGQANYSASKAGLIGMSKTVARELGKRGVTSNCVAPGFIQSDMTDVLPEKVKEAAKSAIPMQKFGTVDDVASLVAFLCSDDTGYVTGQVIGCDGGMAM